ncbi:MAG: CAP domain-containing protein [Pseudonocardia sp.]|nr:CAP domain-containing protein [Pseudonocardia sp.]
MDLAPGANTALPDGPVTLAVAGPLDLSAVVLGGDGRVGGDADFVFYNQPTAPGVAVGPGRVTVTPGRLRAGAVRVVLVASPDGAAFGAAPVTVVTDGAGRPVARLVPPQPGTERALLLAEIYRRDGGWRLRAVGQGYADGLGGLARDFGVVVDDEPAGPEAEVVAATNAERARHGLGPLTVDTRLAAAAQAHTEDMVRRAFFAHENPDGKQVWDRALAAGYAYRKVAENIAAGQRTPAEVVRGWMDSPGHRANIVDGALTQIGVGRAVGGEYGVHWTQVFGTPR